MTWPCRFLDAPSLRTGDYFPGSVDFDKLAVGDMCFYHQDGAPCIARAQLARLHLTAHYFAHNASRPPLICTKCGKKWRECKCGVYTPKGHYDGWTVAVTPPLITVAPSINFEHKHGYHGHLHRRRLRGPQVQQGRKETAMNPLAVRQRGNIYLYGIIALFIVSVGVGVVYTYNSAIRRAETAEADNTKLREMNSEALAENQHLRTLKQQQDLILAERQGRRNATAELERKIDATLSKAMQQPEVRKWADAPVPQSIVDSMRGDAGRAGAKDRGLPAAGKPAAAGPRR